MTRPLRFSKAELANAASIVREHGVAVKLDRDGAMVLFPDKHKPEPVDSMDEEDLDAELKRFKAKHGYD